MAKKDQQKKPADSGKEPPANQPPASQPPPSKQDEIRVRPVKQPVGEGDVTYQKGQAFSVTQKRAKALGPLVEPAED